MLRTVLAARFLCSLRDHGSSVAGVISNLEPVGEHCRGALPNNAGAAVLRPLHFRF